MMTDDIVTRLRATTTVKGWYDDSPDVVFKNNPLCYEAADEIERLRKERDRWIQCAEMLVEHEGEEGLDKAMVFYYESQQLSHEAIHGQ